MRRGNAGRLLCPPLILTALSCGGSPGSGAPVSPAAPVPAAQALPDVQTLPAVIGEPCPGVVVRGDRPERRSSLIRTTLLVDWRQGASGRFDWTGPYYDDEDSPANRRSYPLLEVNIADWRVEEVAGGIRHSLEIEWPPFLETGLSFSVDAGGCERRELVCGPFGCQLRP